MFKNSSFNDNTFIANGIKSHLLAIPDFNLYNDRGDPLR
jgi:hypothetical protein